MTDLVARLRQALAGRYTIERELGQGGMATVYLAHDPRHDRRVALKVLRPELAAVIGAERFLSEIKTTANLQHPHILPLFDSGEAEGQLYYVMPYVEGESLRDRLQREKQLPLADATRIAGEVASALDYAHRHGIIHRDIKPENILLHDSRALVADFGIALAASKAGGTRMTETGMSLGTPAYMSPEQAMGERDLDARSDVYALGCVLYELLTGEPPFTGPTAQAIVAKVMTATPEPVTSLRRTVPPGVAVAVHQAIEKLPADRFASAAEFGGALERGGTGGTGRTGRMDRTDETARPARRLGGPALVAGVGLLGLIGMAVAYTSGRRASGTAGPGVYDMALPDSATMSFAAATATSAYGVPLRNLAISADGSFAVYAARHDDSTSLWYRSLRDATARPIGGTRGGTAPRISPDGSRVAFLVADQVMVVPVSGGEARRLMEGQATALLDWTSPTQLIAIDVDGNRISWLDADGGSTRSKAIPRCVVGRWIPQLRKLICGLNRIGQVVDPETEERWTIRAEEPDGSAGRPVVGTEFQVVDGRHLVYLSADGRLMAAPLDPTTWLAGRPIALVAGIRREAIGAGQYDLSANGTLLHAPGKDATLGRLVQLRAGGLPKPLPLEPADIQRYDLSRDGRWLAAVVQAAEGTDVRIFDLRDGQRFTWYRAGVARHVLWSPDGEGLLLMVRDTTHSAILRGTPSSGVPPDTLAVFLTPAGPDPVDYHDEHTALAQGWEGSVLMRFDPAMSRPTFDTIVTGGRFGSISPNGKLVAYQALESGRIIATAFPTPGRRWQLASEGVEPLWLSAGEVVYRSGVVWYLARLNPETGEPLGAPTFWGRDPRFSDTSGWSNRLSHDGGIIYVQGPEESTTGYLRVMPNWVGTMESAVRAGSGAAR